MDKQRDCTFNLIDIYRRCNIPELSLFAILRFMIPSHAKLHEQIS